MTPITNADLFPHSEVYDARYYGNEQPYRANYVNYNSRSNPHWAVPLARWLTQYTLGPVLDVGCAFGFLVRALNQLGVAAHGVEWSKYAWQQRVHPNVERQDARQLSFPTHAFAAVTSLDLLEHFAPEDTQRVMDEMVRVLRPGGLMVHVIGAHNPADDLSRHLEDPTHLCHEPLSWYIDRFRERGVLLHDTYTAELKAHPVFAPTDWAGRILAFTLER